MGSRITRAATHLCAEEVQRRIQGEQRPWCRQRWQIISQALTTPRQAKDIAKTVGVSIATVHCVIASSNRRGVAAIETPGKGGRRHQYLTLEQERTLLQPFLARAARGELTTVVEIQYALEAQLGHAVHKSTWERLLDRHGWKQRQDASNVAQAHAEIGAQTETVPTPEQRKQPSPLRSGSRENAPQRYPSDLTDQEWHILEPLIPSAKSGGRPRTVNIREVLNAILYLDRTGGQWRALPHDFPPWPTVWTKPAKMAQRWHVGAHAYGSARSGARETRP